MEIDAHVQALSRIHILAAIELAVGRLLSDQVSRARQELNLSWAKIGDAAGVSDSWAHKTWRDVTKGERVESRRHTRRGEYALRQLDSVDLLTLHEVLDAVGSEVRSPRPARPWADAIRHTLSYRAKTAYQETAHDRRLSVFYVNQYALTIRCIEPTANDPGRVVARSEFDDEALFDWQTHWNAEDPAAGQRNLIDFVLDTLEALPRPTENSDPTGS